MPLANNKNIHQGWSPQCEKVPALDDDDWGVLKTTAIQAGFFLPEHNKRLPDKLSPRPLLEVKKGDIIMTCAGPRKRCGVACLVRKTRRRLLISGKMYRFRPWPDLIKDRYLESYLQTISVRNVIDSMKTGVSDSGLNLTQDRFRKLLIRVAPFKQQKLIVEEIEKQFSRLDEAVAALKRIEANLKRYKTSVLKEAVSGKWDKFKISALLAEPLRNGHSAKVSPSGWGIPTFTLTAVTYGDFSDSNIKMTVADKKRVQNLWVKNGDIFIERSNTPELVGTSRLYRGKNDRAIFPDLLIRLRVKDQADPRWVEICLNSEPLRRYFISRAQGISGSMPKIDQKTVMDAELPLPSLDIQHKVIFEVERKLSITEEIEIQLKSNLKRAERLRQSILNKAFSGKLI